MRMIIKPDIRLLVISVLVAGGGQVGEGEVNVLLLIEDVLVAESRTNSSEQWPQPKQPQMVKIIFYEGPPEGEGWVDGYPEGSVGCHVGDTNGDWSHQVVGVLGNPEVEQDNHEGEQELQAKHRLVFGLSLLKSPIESQHDGGSSNGSSTLS